MNIGGIQESGGLLNDTDGYSFTNQANRQSILSVTSTLGAELSYAFSTTTLAAVIIPKIHAEWVHEYENGARQLNTNYIAASSNTKPWVASPQSITIAGPVRDWANLGVGVQMQFPHAIVGYLNYDTLFIQDASNQSVSGGVRINF